MNHHFSPPFKGEYLVIFSNHRTSKSNFFGEWKQVVVVKQSVIVIFVCFCVGVETNPW